MDLLQASAIMKEAVLAFAGIMFLKVVISMTVSSNRDRDER
jgi:hypothetical protein